MIRTKDQVDSFTCDEMLIRETTFVIVDLETTGTSATANRIIEIGAVKVRANTIEDTFQTLIDPNCAIPRAITRITGITTADVYGEPQASEVLQAFIDFVGDDIFVAHNCSFDWNFIQEEIQRAQLPTLNNKKLCTLRLARRLLSGLRSRSLGSLITFFDIDTESRHRALSDALATHEVFLHLLDRLEKQHDIVELNALLQFQHQRYAKQKENPRITHIRQQILPTLPDSPGVYQMLGKKDHLLYVGKARVLSDRVHSYFSGIEGHQEHIRRMVRQVVDVRCIPTSTELEALLLESQLIKEHAPPFNKAGRSYRKRPFLRLGDISNSTWLTLVEHIRPDGAYHYGPMGGRKEAIHVARALISIYGDPTDAFQSFTRDGVGVSSSQIGGKLKKDAFEQVKSFLEGRDPTACSILKSEIQKASHAQEYEMAAQMRDWLTALETVESRPHFLRTPLLNRTGAILYQEQETFEIHLMVCGAPVAHVLYPCKEPDLQDATTKFHQYVLHPPTRITMQHVDRTSILGAWMFKQQDHISVLPLSEDIQSSAFDAALHSHLERWSPQ